MNFKDSVQPPVSGKIQSYLVPHSDKNIKLLFKPKSNVICYTGADILANLLAGNEHYLPTHVGFIYGTTDSPGLADPENLDINIKRSHDWAKIVLDVEGVKALGLANVLVSPLACAPTIMLDGDSAKYTGNAVTFSAHTGTIEEYAFPTDGVDFAPTFEDINSVAGDIYIYHVLLLNRFRSGSTITYTPFSRAALATQPFDAKPSGFDLGVYWTITFK